MDFHQLSIFLAVAEELHFGRAAERLHMAQPPVSRAVAQLEKSLGVKLFERSTRRVELTPVGVQVVESAKQVLASVQELQDRVQATTSGDLGQVSIVFAGASTHRLVGQLSRGLRRRHPGITPNFFSQRFAGGALSQVIEGHADIVLGRWDFIPPEVDSVVVLNEQLVMAVPADHPLADEHEVSIRAFKHEHFIELNVHDSVLPDRLRRMTHAARFQPKIIQRVSDTWTALALVGAEVGVMLTLDSVQKNVQDQNVRFIPVIDDPKPIELRMAWRSKSINPVLPRTLEVAAEVWGLDEDIVLPGGASDRS